uniref:Uncharacterized protein n=1 Tax=Anguilla anguilla TaxID=7936 RepID=A0A0E9QSZ0_ANGAN
MLVACLSSYCVRNTVLSFRNFCKLLHPWSCLLLKPGHDRLQDRSTTAPILPSSLC